MVVLLPLLSLLGGVAAQPINHDEPRPEYHKDAGVLRYVNPMIGTYGTSPNGNGGMIPSVSTPFGMTRWTPQTRENFISQVPYGASDRLIHGFQATHQPAIWMGESGQVVLTPGMGDVQPLFQNRGLAFRKRDERSTPYVYEVLLDATQLMDRDWNATAEAAGDGPDPGGAGAVPSDVKEGSNGRIRKRQEEQNTLDGGLNSERNTDSEYQQSIQVALSAKSHASHLRFDFQHHENTPEHQKPSPWVFIEVSRRNWTGEVHIDADRREIYGYNTERQDYLLGPDRATSFKGFFVSRFSEPFIVQGVTNGNLTHGDLKRTGNFTGAYVKFHEDTTRVEVRTGVSFVSIEQARRNLDLETPASSTLEETVDDVKKTWLEKLGRVIIEGVNQTKPDQDPRTIWYTSLFHSLQYPNDFSEPLSDEDESLRTFYSGYTDSVHTGNDSYYQSWSIWDTYRAEHSILTLFAPERVNSMMRSLLQIFKWSGWLPMWANVVETNIMIATNADAVLANALERGFSDFNVSNAWEAVKKDAFTPPGHDTELLYYDREPFTPAEARAGLTAYMKQGWVFNDHWSEAGSRTLDYAFDDFACSVVARHAGAEQSMIDTLQTRSSNYRKIWNDDTQFMQARNANGSWANNTWGWTEGDDWVYTFDVMHDVKGLAELFGGPEAMAKKMDTYFQDGHNDQTNEPSHHVPYLYSMLGYPDRAAEVIREVAWANYNATSGGLGGNEDLGQMSAWYLFTALGFYPVNPASDEYVVGTPFFEKVSIRLPAGAANGGKKTNEMERVLVISAPGAPNKPYIQSLKIDGKDVLSPIIKHSDIVGAARIDFEMSGDPTTWGTRPVWLN